MRIIVLRIVTYELKKVDMLSKKTRYAMVALVYLAKEDSSKAVLSTEISKNEKIPQRFLENILLELKKMGLMAFQVWSL